MSVAPLHEICITFDTDWIPTGVMEEMQMLDLFPGASTHFCTGHYDYLADNRHRVEFAPHPNFHQDGAWSDILDRIERQLPYRGRGFRAHCLGYSQRIAMGLHERGYSYASQATRLEETGLAPYRHTWGIWEMPIYYCDNTDFSEQAYWKDGRPPFRRSIIENALNEPGLYIFMFHPVHLALNTPSLGQHQQVRDRFYDVERWAHPDLVYRGYGAMNFFLDLVEAMRRAEMPSRTLEEVLSMVEHQPRWTSQLARSTNPRS